MAGCLSYALTHDVDDILGGTTSRERKQIRTANQITYVEPVTTAGLAAFYSPLRTRRAIPGKDHHCSGRTHQGAPRPRNRSASNGMTPKAPASPAVFTCPTCGSRTQPMREGAARNALPRHPARPIRPRWKVPAAKERPSIEERTPQPCRHPIARHQHGTRAAYVAESAAARNAAQPTPSTSRDGSGPTPTAGGPRRSLMPNPSAGTSTPSGQRASAVAESQNSRMSPQAHWEGCFTAAPVAHRHPESARPPLNASWPSPSSPYRIRSRRPLDAVGTRRRIQSLAWVGWSIPQLAARAGVDKQSLHRALRHEQVTAATATAVRNLYDRLWNVTPTPPTGHAATAVTRTRNRARAQGWHPPMAWDNIDDPNETPTATTATRLSRTEHCIITTAELLDFGVGPDEIARRLNIRPASLQRILHRADRDDLASQLIRAIRRAA